MRDTERKVLEAIDLDGLVTCLVELIAFESVGGNETSAQERVVRLLGELDMDVDLWSIDPTALRNDPAYTVEIDRDHALGVVGTWGGNDGPRLILNGHVDVVPAGDLSRWSVPPFKGTIRDGQVFGRGSADMKGGLCCALFAVRALRDAGVRIAGSVMVQSVVGEEDGGLGTLAAVRRGHIGDAAIVLEPTSLAVSPAQAGALNFRITVPGVAAHGALAHEGVDPIDKFVPVFQALKELERERNARPRHPMFAGQETPYAICVGTVSAGIWASTVAESLTCEGRLGVAVDEGPDEARRELVDAVATVAAADPWLRDHPPVVEWWGAQFAPAVIPSDHRIVAMVAGAHKDVTGTKPAICGMPYGADMRLLLNEGRTPAVLYGPGDVRRAHAPDEYVSIAELETATRTLALTIMRFCGVA